MLDKRSTDTANGSAPDQTAAATAERCVAFVFCLFRAACVRCVGFTSMVLYEMKIGIYFYCPLTI